MSDKCRAYGVGEIMIEVVEAKTRSQMKKFATFPISLYKGNPYFVPSFTADEKNVKNEKVNFRA